MSRPYPVGEKMAVQKPTLSSVLGSWGQLPMYAPFRVDCLRTHKSYYRPFLVVRHGHTGKLEGCRTVVSQLISHES